MEASAKAAPEAIADHYFVYGLADTFRPANEGGPPPPLEATDETAEATDGKQAEPQAAAVMHPLDEAFLPDLLSRFPSQDTKQAVLPSFTHMVQLLPRP